MCSQSNLCPGRLLFLVFLSLLLAGSVLAQISALPPSATDTGLGGANSITGTILGPSGQPVSRRIRISLATMTRGDRVTMTDEKGNFAFRGLPPGNYSVVIDKEKEYEPVSQQVDIIQLRGSPPQSYTMNIRLALKARTEARPGVINSELANVPKRALDFFTKAQELAKTGDHKGAVEQLRQAISEHPDFMLAFNELGIEYLRLNELEKADESLLSALKIDPEAFAPLLNRGIVLVLRKKFDEAESVLRKALKVKEQSAPAHYFLGQALANLGRFDEAEKELVTAIKLGGEEMKEAHRLLAIIYSTRGDKKRAATELETYLRLAPTTPDAEQLRKVIQQLKGSGEPSPTPSSEKKPSS
jgi:Flp pilus assembly protein TadD